MPLPNRLQLPLMCFHCHSPCHRFTCLHARPARRPRKRMPAQPGRHHLPGAVRQLRAAAGGHDPIWCRRRHCTGASAVGGVICPLVVELGRTVDASGHSKVPCILAFVLRRRWPTFWPSWGAPAWPLGCCTEWCPMAAARPWDPTPVSWQAGALQWHMLRDSLCVHTCTACERSTSFSPD